MIDTKIIYNFFLEKKISCIYGVPDSILSDLLVEFDKPNSKIKNYVTSNEGNAVATAIGQYLGSSKPAIVYLQNSGLGNIINPIISLAHKSIYKIPMFLIIGWRGDDSHKDEPQHIEQGRITLKQLKLLSIKFWILEKNSNPTDILNNAWNDMILREQPVAILVRNKTFKSKNIKIYKNDQKLILRENFLERFIRLASPTDMIVSTTGKTSRELYEIKKAISDIDREFLVIGGMGHSSGISMGLALSNPNKRVLCLDGDGSMLMHLGSLPTIGCNTIKNFTYFLINNGCHESVGGQPTIINKLDIKKLSECFNFNTYNKISHLEELDLIYKKIEIKDGPHFIEVLVQNKSRKNLIRPSETPKMLKSKFMAFVRKNRENNF